MKKAIIVMTGIFTMATVTPAAAGGSGRAMQGMQHGSHGGQEQTQGMFLVKKEIDGYTVSFHAMQAQAGMQHDGTHHSAGKPNGTGEGRPQGEGQDVPSHNLMVKVEKDGQALAGLTANSKVVHPDGTSESKMLMAMGDWYMAGYDLGHAGRHQLMVLFKTADGAKHFGGVYYPDDGQGGR